MTDKEWTIMVYLAGDNNLSEEMITALTGMKLAMSIPESDQKINLVAVYDSGYPTALMKHYKFTNDNSRSSLKNCETKYIHPQVGRRGTEERQETAYIIDFVRWSAENFPAQNYALILSGHSDGIIGRTMFQDSNPSTALHLKKLRYILSRAQRHLRNAEKFALIGFDSCLMNMAEVGYELRTVTDVLVASEGNVPTSGWSYFDIVDALVNRIQAKDSGKPEDVLTTQTFAKLIVDKFINFSENYNIGGRSVNISACDLNQSENLREAVNQLAVEFNEILSAPIKPQNDAEKEECNINALMIEKLKNLIQTSHYYSQTFLYEQAVDLSDFVKALSSNCDLAEKEIELFCGEKIKTETFNKLSDRLTKIKAKCGNVNAEVDKYVLASGSSGSEYQFSSGVSLFFPWSLLALYMIYRRYENLSFSREGAGAWFNFIEDFTKLTYRATGEPLYREDLNYLDWRDAVAASNKDVSAKDVSAKDVSAKSESDSFYKFFKRFRNHPINHDIAHKNIKPPYEELLK